MTDCNALLHVTIILMCVELIPNILIRSGPVFGSGADLCISSNCNINEESYCNFPSSYGKDHNVDHNFLAGKKYFIVEDYEVYCM